MTQQGFRKFRRRNSRQQDAAVQPAADRLVPPQADGSGQLPAVLPEPWDLLRPLPLDLAALEHLPQAAPGRSSAPARAIDLLRTRLLQTLKARGWRRVAVTAPSPGCGTTFTAVNLALSLARVPDCRTVLMDLNLRKPGVAAALGVAGTGDMPGFLSGQLSAEQHLQRAAGALALGLNAAARSDAAELLHGSSCSAAIDGMMQRMAVDVALFDLPAVLEHDDVAAFLPQVDGVLLISDGTRTTAAELAACEKMLAGQAPLLGVALNRARR
ncbi:CpsD/CapB family tyrosine-protein kinase [Roseobacteraceae bacterium NS-SX3]